MRQPNRRVGLVAGVLAAGLCAVILAGALKSTRSSTPQGLKSEDVVLRVDGKPVTLAQASALRDQLMSVDHRLSELEACRMIVDGATSSMLSTGIVSTTAFQSSGGQAVGSISLVVIEGTDDTDVIATYKQVYATQRAVTSDGEFPGRFMALAAKRQGVRESDLQSLVTTYEYTSPSQLPDIAREALAADTAEGSFSEFRRADGTGAVYMVFDRRDLPKAATHAVASIDAKREPVSHVQDHGKPRVAEHSAEVIVPCEQWD